MSFFTVSKVFELWDTFFIVVRKRPLILLHWYHHVTVLCVCPVSVCVSVSVSVCVCVCVCVCKCVCVPWLQPSAIVYQSVLVCVSATWFGATSVRTALLAPV
jgi:hypothetical protein